MAEQGSNSVTSTSNPTPALQPQGQEGITGQGSGPTPTTNAVFRTSSNANAGGGDRGGVNGPPHPMSDGTALQPPEGHGVVSGKKSSFQITSVVVDPTRGSEGGDDSADEADESHTEDSSDMNTDASSRHTSESRGGMLPTVDEKFTRNDVFYNPAPASSINNAPVIPTSSQYGLAIVPEGTNTPTGESTATTTTSVTSVATMNLEGQGGGSDKNEADKEMVHNRFKVVKIVSNEPFKKGRWVCMDYLDHTLSSSGKEGQPSNQPPSNVGSQTTAQPADVINVMTNHSIPPQQQTQAMANVHVNENQNIPTASQQQPAMPSNQPQTMIPNLSTQQQMSNVQQPQTETNLAQHQETVINGLPNGDTTTYMNHYDVPGSHIEAPPSYAANSMVSTTDNVYAPNPNNPPQQQHAYQHPPQPQQQQQYYPPSSNVMPGVSQNLPAQQAIPNQTQQPQIPIPQQPSQQPNQSMVPQMSAQVAPVSQPSNQAQAPASIMPQQQQVHQQQQPPAASQAQHVAAQSLPHGAHAAAMAAAAANQSTSNVNGPPPPQQPQQQPQHLAAQSLGHGMLQHMAPAQNQGGYHQQMPVGAQGYTQAQGNTQTMMTSQPSNQPPQMQMTSQPPVQDPSGQQGYQYANMNVQNIGMQHVQQIPQGQGAPGQVYATPSQMMQHPVQVPMSAPMSGPQSMVNPQQQPQQIQQMMPPQPQIVSQHQPMMGVPVQQQPPAPSQQSQQPPTQTMMQQPQIVPQMMQSTQHVQPPGMVPQQTMMSQGAPNPMVSQTGVGQPALMQTLPPQSTYVPTQPGPPISTQANLPTQPMMQQFTPQPQQPTIINHPQPSQPHVQPQPQIAQPNQGQPQPQAAPGVSSQSHPTMPQQSQQPTAMPMQGQTSQQQQQAIYQQQHHQQIPGNYNNGMPTMHQMISTSAAHPHQMSIPIQPHTVTSHQTEVVIAAPDIPHSHATTTTQPPPTSQQVSAPQQPQESHSQQSLTSSTGTPHQQQPTIASLTAAANVIVEGISSVVHEAAAAAVGNLNEDGESASGTNTVAIDNKIEQAMDLVKSHLMFAVREEVEVLKEKIAELMERITQLEYENNILRQNATPETLAQLKGSVVNPPNNQS